MNHVLTPYSRHFNLIELGNRIKEEGCTWHLLSIKGETVLPDLGSWVHQYHFDAPPENFFAGHWLINQFLDNVVVNDEDRYQVLTDDDYLPLGFWKSVDALSGDIIITSMQRSNIPSGNDPNCAFSTLLAAPENMKIGHVGFEQLVIRGKLLKQYRLASHYEADGTFLMKLFEDHCENFVFAPNLLVYFDYLFPGRGKCNRWQR